jgi:hypothetical protein
MIMGRVTDVFVIITTNNTLLVPMVFCTFIATDVTHLLQLELTLQRRLSVVLVRIKSLIKDLSWRICQLTEL